MEDEHLRDKDGNVVYRALADGEESEMRDFEGLSTEAQRLIMAGMSSEMRAELGGRTSLSQDEVAHLLEKYYDLNHYTVLWLRPKNDPSRRFVMRSLLSTSLEPARKELLRQLPHFADRIEEMTVCDVMSFGVPMEKYGTLEITQEDKSFTYEAAPPLEKLLRMRPK
jgi:hypothetical protein